MQSSTDALKEVRELLYSPPPSIPAKVETPTAGVDRTLLEETNNLFLQLKKSFSVALDGLNQVREGMELVETALSHLNVAPSTTTPPQTGTKKEEADGPHVPQAC
jgi:hypothetical protein